MPTGPILTPFISILIPTYRRLQLLSQVLAVCLEQAASYAGAVEIVVIDNCAEGSAKNTVTELSQTSPIDLRYVHEARKGLATVRNTALRAARGTYIIFLDDDQLPQQGWLEAFMSAARKGAKAAFGPLEPLYEVTPKNNAHLIKRMFSRNIRAEDGAGIGRYCPYLGTGNSLFEKASCFPDDALFDELFNLGGGEDVWLLTGLQGRGIPFTWVARAHVLEYVPADRIASQYLQRRRYRSGQLRVLLSLHPARRRPEAVLLLMGAGAAQAGINAFLSGLFWLFWRDRAGEFWIKAYAGLGKIFWFRSPVVWAAARREG